jgi:hypothetical protein
MMHHATARLPEADHVRLEAIAKTYAPYDRFPAFWQGVEDYLNGVHKVWEDRAGGVDGQAYDRGLNAAMRLQRGLFLQN